MNPTLEKTIDYSVIYYIHADSDYLFHNASGEPIRGNTQVLETAILVGKTAKSGEVFIFHQLPERKLLGLFPRNRSQLYHFRNGEFVSHIKFRHSDKKEDFLSTEARLFNQYQTHPQKKDHRTYFLFFGHEIPHDDGLKYHRTLPNIAVNTVSFSAGIQNFLITDEQRFNLVVLSSCNNGTPMMASHLMPFSDVLLASPINLHLSHIDSNNLRLMDINPEIPSVQLAHAIADQTFRRLESEINTAITLTVFDFEIIQEQKNKLNLFIASHSPLANQNYVSNNIDCGDLSFFDSESFGNGIRTWFKPAKFGRNANITSHSGWGCKPLLNLE
jgi:hypothetical protein